MILLRSALFNAAFFALTAVLSLAGCALLLTGRRHILGVARLWARLVLRAARLLAGIRLEVTGREHLPPTGPALIASQHQSAFDTVVWLTLLPGCCYVLKKELTRIPFFGRLLVASGMIVIDRSAGTPALRGMVRDAKQAAAQGREIVIFPEGTRAAPGERLPLQPGIAALAAATSLPVIPAVTDSGLYWGRRAFQKRPGTIHLRLLPQIPPGLDRRAVMERLETAFKSPANGCSAVDNSVGTPASELPHGCKPA